MQRIARSDTFMPDAFSSTQGPTNDNHTFALHTSTFTGGRDRTDDRTPLRTSPVRSSCLGPCFMPHGPVTCRPDRASLHAVEDDTAPHRITPHRYKGKPVREPRPAPNDLTSRRTTPPPRSPVDLNP